MTTLAERVLSKYPNFIARHYQRFLVADAPRQKVEAALSVYEVSIRALALSLISQYLIRDKETVRSDSFSELISEALTDATFGTWTNVFFAAMEAYKDRPDLLFMPQLHDLYWQLDRQGYAARPEVHGSFAKMVQIYADLHSESPAHPKSDADWEKLASDAVETLERFLENFAFIESYEVIRILAKDDDGYQYKNYTGCEATVATSKLPADRPLVVGWYYLYNWETGESFHLHPLLVFLTNLPPSVEQRSEATGFFDHLDRETTYYWEPTLGQITSRSDLMSTVLDWVYFAIERYKAYRREISQLDWKILQEVCRAISRDSMGDSQKYQRDLYLQREEVLSAFRNFLDSEKTCFVLTGKSGVGKTNFVLSLLDDYQREGGDICLLVYNGAFLSVNRDIKEEINEQFNQRLKFQGREEQARIEDFLLEINRISGIAKRRFVLIVDAINENPEPAQLLKGIDRMMRSAGEEQRWFKIVITSRPEAWRRIYRQAKPLAENRYYRLLGQQELGVEMPEFQLVGTVNQDLSHTIPRFGKEEVKAAYDKYQRKFRLGTNYGDLRSAVRTELRDPLIMRLVAEMYTGKAIPATIRINDIYRDYVKALIHSDPPRLQEEDEEFLQREIVPLMAESGYTNEVTAQQINRHGLRAQVLGKEIDSSGRAINQSYQNLSDAEILIRQDSVLDYVLRFSFERFYDYYFGQYLYSRIKGQQEPEPLYLEWVEAIWVSPFLWGAVKQTLLQHLHDLPNDAGQNLIASIAQRANQPVKELLVTTLADYSRDEPQSVQQWLDQLLNNDPLDQDGITTSQRVAIESAAQIEYMALLEEAAKVKSEPIRAVAVQYIYYVWRKNPKVGWSLLENLSRDVKGRLLPRSEVLQSCLAFSLTLLFGHHNEQEVGQKLREIWRQTMNDVFFISSDKLGGWQENIKAKVRGVLLESIVQFMVRNLGQLSKQDTLGAADLHHFWKGPGRKDRFVLFNSLVNLLDLKTHTAQDMRQVLMTSVENRDILCFYVAALAMSTYLHERPREALPVVSEYFEAGKQVKPAPPSFGYTPWSVHVMMYYQDKIDPEFWQTFVGMVRAVLDTTQGRWSSAENSFRYMYLHTHDVLYERLYGEFLSPTARQFLDERIKAKDYEPIIAYVSRELKNSGSVRLIITALRFILSYNIESEELINSIVTLLRRTRTYYPEEVEDFLSEPEVPTAIRNLVQTQGTSERLHDLWGVQTLEFFQDVFMFAGENEARRALYWLLGQATKYKDLSGWLTLLFKGAVNLIYGGPVFPDVPFEWGKEP